MITPGSAAGGHNRAWGEARTVLDHLRALYTLRGPQFKRAGRGLEAEMHELLTSRFQSSRREHRGRLDCRPHHLSSALNSERPSTCRSLHSCRISAVVAGWLRTAVAASAGDRPSTSASSSGPSAASSPGSTLAGCTTSALGPSSAKLCRQTNARVNLRGAGRHTMGHPS